MRNLILLRGATSSGKSTWIRENNLQQYTLSADDIRLLFESPIMNKDGQLTISQKNDNRVWELLFELIEERLSKGEFTIVDATHSRIDMLTRYKNIADKYRARLNVIEFIVEFEELIKRNDNREEYKKVPKEVLERTYTRIKTQETPKYCPVIKKEEFKDFCNIIKDFSSFDKIVVIGDLHGCYQPLDNYFKDNPFNSNNFYIFVGDYFDRGIQNYEILKFLYDFSQNKNVLLLEGNHERWLKEWGYYEYSGKCDFQIADVIKSKQFLDKTLPELITKGYTKQMAREFCRKLGQLAYFKYFDKVFLITHGGLSNLPTIFTSTEEFIKGVGKYEDSLEVDNSFVKNTPENTYQIHGHRNIYNESIKNTNRTFNLSGEVEFGKPLRILEINEKEIKQLEYENTIFDKTLTSRAIKETIQLTDKEQLQKLMLSNDLIKKDCGNSIYSFNFSRDVFYDKKWNNVTTKARGLFIDINKEKIVARSYDKFFNINERDETKIANLSKLDFPIIGYRKYNGYLGLLSYYNNDWFITSKSAISGDFAQWFKDILIKKEKLSDKLKEFIIKNDVTFIFEVIDPENDPHIISYDKKEIILLDIVYNSFNYKKMGYSELKFYGDLFHLKVKEKDLEFKTYKEFADWYFNTRDKYMENDVEGWVFEDCSGAMIKFKTNFYNIWKHLRSLKDRFFDRRFKMSELSTELDNKFYKFILSKDKEYVKNTSIIELRDEYNKMESENND